MEENTQGRKSQIFRQEPFHIEEAELCSGEPIVKGTVAEKLVGK